MFLLWVRSFDGTLAPQVAHDSDNGRPYIDAGIRARVASWLPLSPDEASLPLRELARRHPPRMGRMLADAVGERQRVFA